MKLFVFATLKNLKKNHICCPLQNQTLDLWIAIVCKKKA